MSAATTSTVSYTVEGLTCGQCIVKVIEHVRGLPEVEGVAVDLIRGGESVVTIRSDPETSFVEVVTAVEEAGFDLTGQTDLSGHWPGAHSTEHPGEMTRPSSWRGLDLLEGDRR